MFVWLNKQGVKSKKGFIVQSIDRFAIEYRENARTISVYVERGCLSNSRFCVSIRSDAFLKWDDGTIITPTQQKEILQNFTDAMNFQNIDVVVYDE